MCGIVGIATRHTNGFSKAEVDTFTELVFFDTLRGFDSTGVFGVDKNANVDIHKKAVTGAEFIRHDKFSEFRTFLLSKGMFAVGHNRAATRGSVKDENAHPFWDQDKIVLVQNGTYRGSHKSLKDTEVDTEAVAHVLAEEPNVETALRKVNASYALVWFNTETKTLNLIRNDERPLWLMNTKNGGLVWASEPSFIYYSCRRNGLELSEDPVVQVPAHTLVSLQIDGNKWVREDKPLDCGYRFPIQQQNHHNVPANWPHFRRDNDSIADDFPIQNQVNYALEAERNRRILQATQRRSNRDDIECGGNETVFRNYPEYCYTEAEAFDAVDEVGKLDKNKQQFVEVLDYVAGNKNPQCQSWHIVGHFVDTNGDENHPAAKVVCHWFLYDRSEQEVKAYVNHGWYKGKISAIRKGTYNDKKSIVTVMMNDVEPVIMSQEATA